MMMIKDNLDTGKLYYAVPAIKIRIIYGELNGFPIFKQRTVVVGNVRVHSLKTYVPCTFRVLTWKCFWKFVHTVPVQCTRMWIQLKTVRFLLLIWFVKLFRSP